MPGASLHVAATGTAPPVPRATSQKSTAPSTATRDASPHTRPPSRSRSAKRSETTSQNDRETSSEDEDGLERPWRDDKALTAVQLASIKAEQSHYGQTKAYNIIRNRRMLEEMKLGMAKDVVSAASTPSAPAVQSTHGQDSGTPSSRPQSPQHVPSTQVSPRAPSAHGLFLSSPQHPPSSPVRSNLSATLARESLSKRYPSSSRWPPWMKGIIPVMEGLGPKCAALSDAMEAWVEFEDLMGHPDSKVRRTSIHDDFFC